MNQPYLGPAYRIETPRLCIRCYNPEDAPLLQDAIMKSVEHLRPWMPWVNTEPEELKTKVERLRRFRSEFDSNKNFTMGIFNPAETELLGGTGLHPRVGAKAFEIGYWIHVDHVNKGYATETSEALTKVAFEIEKVNRVEIHCDPKNIKSAAIPKKLGFVFEANLRKRTENHMGELIDSMVYSMISEEYLNSSIVNAKISAFDAMGKKIL